MVSYEKVKKEMERMLPEKRYLHSLRVAWEAEKLAKVYKLNSKQMRLSALAHDCTKTWSRKESLAYLEIHNVPVTEEDKMLSAVLHGKVAATWCAERYQFSDGMCKAISYHTTGHKDMDLFAKVLFIADKIETKKEYNGIKEVRKFAYQDIDIALLFYLNGKIEKAILKGKRLHSDTYILHDLLQKTLFYKICYTPFLQEKKYIKKNPK